MSILDHLNDNYFSKNNTSIDSLSECKTLEELEIEYRKIGIILPNTNKKKRMKNEKSLRTKVLPKYNCSNCKHFVSENKNIQNFGDSSNDFYAKECNNQVHPLEDCVLRGFESHSEQPGFSQTLNK